MSRGGAAPRLSAPRDGDTAGRWGGLLGKPSSGVGPLTAGRPAGAGRSIATLLAGETINKATRFVAAVVLARSLTLEQFGYLNVGIAVAGLALMATTLGLPDSGARQVAVDPAAAGRVAGMVVAGRTIALALVAVPAVGIVLVVDRASVPVALLVAAMAVCLAGSLDWLLRGQGRMGAVAAAAGIGGTTVLVGALAVSLLKPTTSTALAVFAAGELVATITTWRFTVGRAPRLSTVGLVDAAQASWPLAISAFIVYSSTANLDTLLLSALSSAEEAGLYSAPYRIYLGLNVVGTFAAYAILPRMSREVAAGQLELSVSKLATGLWPLAGYGLLCLAGAEMFGGELLEGLFGSAFADMRATFLLLCAAIGWWSVGFPAGYGLIARDAQRRFLIGSAMAGVLNVGLNLALIPSMGTEGAAVATVVALAAACTSWLGSQGLLRRAGAPVVGALFVGTAGAAACAVDSRLGLPFGVVTALAGAAALAKGRRALQDTPLTGPS
jgi:O-antigen/teichoic acid export membrane protein